MLATGCGLTICSLSCNRRETAPDTRAAAETAIRHADLGWSKAMTDRQLEATVPYDAPDAAIYPPTGPRRRGRRLQEC
jgi:ketosteroid isomerase-like protein